MLVMRLSSVGMTGALLLLTGASAVTGQWTNRYPRVDGFSHHVYLEGYELPMLTAGPLDPAVHPAGDRVAFSARGWIWVMDLETRVARRVTDGPGIDARPAWSPDGELLALVRDDTEDTEIVWVTAATGERRGGVNSEAIDMDPVFSPDGTKVFYSSAENGGLDIWAVDIATDVRRPVTTSGGIEVKPQRAGETLLYLAKGGGRDRVVVQEPGLGERVVATGRIASMARPALSPDGSTVALNWPTQEGWELRLVSVADPDSWVLLYSGGLPLTPAWSPDGKWIWFSSPNDGEQMGLWRVAAVGGRAEAVSVGAWDWGTPTATLRIRTLASEGRGLEPARLEVVDAGGHPLVSAASVPRFEGQNGRVYFYTPGWIEMVVPAGQVEVTAVRGLATPPVSDRVTAGAGEVVTVELELASVWDSEEAGWASGDHHLHLNYGGLYDLSPEDLEFYMEGEGLDFSTPLLANLHDRFEDQDLWGYGLGTDSPVRFGQEVRSHFLGHVGLAFTDELFWPWVWGPGYQVYGLDDRENADALRHARSTSDGFSFYVHPLSSPRGVERNVPWAETPLPGLRPLAPVELVADAVLGDLDGLEIVCLWSDDVTTAQIWYLFLNVGIPIVPTAGTDVMTDFYRTMGVGTARVYARSEDTGWESYAESLRSGRSFVTNGPFLDFRVDGKGPGEVVVSGTGDSGGSVAWTLNVATAGEVETVEILVNGRVVWAGSGVSDPGSQRLEGTLELPSGGWVAARAVGGSVSWPAMANYPFAHTAPIWIGSVGSSDPAERRAAADELLAILEVARQRLVFGYGNAPIPNLTARFSAARERLEELSVP